MRFLLLLLLWLLPEVSSNFMNMLMGSSASTQQYSAYGGCPSSGCVPPTIVPRTSGFWPNSDILTGLQIEQQSSNQNQNSNQNSNQNLNQNQNSNSNSNQNQNTNNFQQDASNNGQLPSGSTGGNIPEIPSGNSNSQPVIYIARAGSEKYKYSEGTSQQSPFGHGPGSNLNNDGTGFQSQNPFGIGGSQNSNQNLNQNQNSNQNQFGSLNSFQPNQNQISNSGFPTGFSNNQNQNSMNSGQGSAQSGLQNNGASSGFFGSSGGFNANQNSQNGNTQQGNTGNFNGQNVQNPFVSGNSQNNQNGNTQGQGSSGMMQGQNSQFGNANQNIPFGPNIVPTNPQQMGPQPFQPIQVGSIRQSPQFPERDWNFQPGSDSVQYVGGGSGTGQIGTVSRFIFRVSGVLIHDSFQNFQGGSVSMTDEAQQIAVQIQAIRDNLSITRDESNYLISQLKASLPQEIQSQLQMF
ncbi:CRE-PQN-8 protein [Caenorhabditis remanei]|uniref:CRE-PQN-8 protein n=1 Tax=Caenorhabditis remanei TaxID=31234 RepID=E3LS25_CAERE|nr:CRE-PQN-8 protein [Caenorhabditis remanei]